MCWKRGEGEGVRGVERGSLEPESRSQEAPGRAQVQAWIGALV
jgi:hypothetical protein